MRSRIRGIWPCLIVVAASGCIDRARVNSRCEWTAETAFALDLRDPAQRRHSRCFIWPCRPRWQCEFNGGLSVAGRCWQARSPSLHQRRPDALGVQLGVVWTAIWESVRIGNDHFGSFRAAVPPWSAHPGALFAGGVVLFWIAAAIALRWPPDERNDRSLGGPDSPLLSGSDYPFGLKR